MECVLGSGGGQTVFDSEVAIDMVALESTNQVPLTLDIRQMWADQRQYPGGFFRC